MRTPLTAFLTAAALALGACGFQPLYATGGVTPSLTRIAVPTPDGRTGQFLREALDDALATNRDLPPAYRLTLEYDEDRYERGLRVDNTANRYEVALQVTYSLADAASGVVIHTGSVRPLLSFDSADQPYQGLAANSDASERAAVEAARLIRLDLSRFFVERPAFRPGPAPAAT